MNNNFVEIDLSCIGFIGLGMMGYPTVKNLLSKGYKVAVYDIKSNKVDELASFGAIPCSSIKQLASQSSFVFTMVTGPAAVKSIYLGPEGLISNLSKKNSYLIESSTIGYSAAQLIRKAAEDEQQIFLDCPISGGTPGAINGTLTFMVGGTPSEFDAVKDFFGVIGKNVFYAGPPSSAQMIKICNNLCFAINMMGAIESYKIISSLGVNPQTFTDIANHSTGGSFVTSIYSPYPNVTQSAPSNDGYNGGYSLNLALKDMYLAQEVANEKGVPIPFLEKAIQLYEEVKNKGFGDYDFSIAFKS